MQPSKILNFADAGKLDSTVVFTRASGTNTHPGTFYDCLGIMRESSYDAPRITYDPVTGVCKGLMMEEARTNLLPYSEDFSQAGWAVLGVTKTGITRAGVGGDMTGRTMTYAAASDSFYTDSYIGVTGSGTAKRTASIHIHTSSTLTDVSLVMFWFIGGTTQQVAYRFNPQTGAFVDAGGTGTLLEYDCVDCSNGWKRYSVGGKGTDSNNTYIRYQIYSNSGSGTLVIDKAQLEDSSTCTSYIPTNGVALSRAKDICSSTSDWADWFDPFEGTVYVEWEKNHNQNRTDIPVYETVCSISSWPTGRYNVTDYGTAYVYGAISTDGAIPYSSGGTAEMYRHKQKCFALAWKTNDTITAMNGVLYNKSTNIALPKKMTSSTLWIGNETGSSQLNGTIKKIVLYPNRLTDAQLQQLTQVKEEIVDPSFTLTFSGEGSFPAGLMSPNPAAYRQNAAGNLEWVAANSPKLDYENGKCLGLLGEKASTNIAPYASNFTNWGTGYTVTLNTTETLDPAGTYTATKLLNPTTGSLGYKSPNITVSVNTVYTISAYFKKGTSQFFMLSISDNVDSGCNTWVNADTLAVTSAPFGWTPIDTTIIEPKSNGWYRIIITLTSNSTDTVTTLYCCHTNANNNLTVTAGEYGYIWGPQMEPGYIATSFIPNYTATIGSRGADVYYICTSNKIINSHVLSTFTRSETTLGASVEMPYGDIGTPIGAKIVESANYTYKNILCGTTVAIKTRIMVHSWVVKKADAARPWVYFEAYVAGGGTRCYCRFNLDTMVFDDFYSSGGATSLSTKAFPLGQGWYRIVRVIDHGPVMVLGAVGAIQVMSMVNAAGATLFTGDGTSGIYTGAWQAYELTDGLTAYEPYTNSARESAYSMSMAWYNPAEGTITKESYRKYKHAITGPVAEVNTTLMYSGVGGFFVIRDVQNTRVDGATWPYHDSYCYTGASTKDYMFDSGNIPYRYGEPIVQTIAYKSGSFETMGPDYVDSYTGVPTGMPLISLIYLSHSFTHCHIQKFTYTPRKYTDRSSTLQLKPLDDVRSPSFQLNFAKSKIADPVVSYYRGDVLPCATVVGNNNKVSVVPANTGRITHSMIDGSCRGLLVEDTSSNVIDTEYSYYLTESTVIQGNIIAPDGTMARAFVPKAGYGEWRFVGDYNRQRYAISLATNASQIFSYSEYFASYGPAGYKPYIVIGAYTATSTDWIYALVFFNPTDGTFQGEEYNAAFTSVLPPTAVKTQSGMWKVTWAVKYTQPALARSYVFCNLQVGTSAGSRQFIADGLSGFQMWGGQFEARHTPTSFINNPYSYNTGARSTPATYYNSSGLVATAPAYTARNNYHPNYLTLAPRLLYETATYNYMAYTESFNTWWAPNTVTITANATTAPDGTVSADKMVEDNTSNQHLISQVPSTAVAINEYWTISIFAKAAERTQIFLTAYGENYSVFDLSNGTVVQAGGSNVCVIEKLPNGWYRCGATIKKSNSTANMYYGIWNGSNAYTGDGTSGLYIWGAQVEPGGAMTSYIPNTGSSPSAPRAADYSIFSGYTRAMEQHSFTNANVTKWYNQYEGTFAVKFKTDFPSPTVVQYPSILSISDDTYNNRINIASYNNSDSAGITIIAGGVSQYDGPFAAPIGFTHTLVAGYKDNRLIIAIDGKVCLDISSAITLPKNLKTMHVGNLLGGNWLNGTIEYINYYPVLLTTQEIQQLSCQ